MIDFLRKRIAIKSRLKKFNIELVNYNAPERRKELFVKIKNLTDEGLLMSKSEAYQLFTMVKSTNKVMGDMAEVGVYKGQSAKLILEASNPEKELHLFDTFSGLPQPTKEDLTEHSFVGGEYCAGRELVETYLANYSKRIKIHEGKFPDTSEPVKNKTFSFVNIDVDLYQGTLESLKFFYPKMNPGGIIMSHDYIMDGGVRDAIEEFFSDKPEPIIEVGAGTQAFIVKCSS